MNASLWQLAGWTMIHSLWLGAAVALAGGFLRLACRRATPNARYAISLATLTLLAATPIAATGWLSVNGVPQLVANNESILLPPPGGEGWGEGQPQVHAPDLTIPIEQSESNVELASPRPAIIDLAQATPAELDAIAAQQQSPQALPTNSSATLLFPLSPFPPPPSSLQSPITSHLSTLIPHLPTLWLIGAPLTFTLLATGLIGSERLRRRATPLTAGPAYDACQRLRQTLTITRRVALAVCDDVAQPILVGIVRPLILLPTAALAGWTPEQLDMVLLHELAHVRRWDNLVNLLQRIVESLLFFHPAVWLVSRQVRRDREECCDAAVIRHTDRPEAYATLLIDIASRLRLSGSLSPTQSLTVASAMASHPLAGRIRRILNIEAEPMRITRRTLAATLLLPLLLAGAIFYSGASAEDTPSAKEQSSEVDAEDAADSTSLNNAENPSKASARAKLIDEKLEEDATSIRTVYPIPPGTLVDPIELAKAIQSRHPVEIAWAEHQQGIIVSAPQDVHERVAALIKKSAAKTAKFTDDTFKPVMAHNLVDGDNAPLVGGYGILEEFSADADPSKIDAAIERLKAEKRSFSVEQSDNGSKRIVDQTPPAPESTPTKPAIVRNEYPQYKQLRELFTATEANPAYAKKYRVPPGVRKLVEDMFAGLETDPYGPQISFHRVWSDDERTVEVTAPMEAQAQYLDLIFGALSIESHVRRLENAQNSESPANATPVDISQFQNEIRKFEDLTAKAQKELVDLEVFKELSAQSGPERSSGLEEAIAEDLAQDPTINTYKSQLVELNATLQTKLSESKNPNTLEIKRLRTVIQQTEAEMAKYQAEASRALREKYAHIPKNAKLAAEREYKIRRLGVEVDLAEYQQQLLHYKQKLAEANAQLDVPQAIGTYATPTIAAADAIQRQITNEKPTANDSPDAGAQVPPPEPSAHSDSNAPQADLRTVLAETKSRLQRQLADLKARAAESEGTEAERVAASALEAKILEWEVMNEARGALRNQRAAAAGSNANDAPPTAAASPNAAPVETTELPGLLPLTAEDFPSHFIVGPENHLSEFTYEVDPKLEPAIRKRLDDALDILRTNRNEPPPKFIVMWRGANVVSIIAAERAQQFLMVDQSTGQPLAGLKRLGRSYSSPANAPGSPNQRAAATGNTADDTTAIDSKHRQKKTVKFILNAEAAANIKSQIAVNAEWLGLERYEWAGDDSWVNVTGDDDKLKAFAEYVDKFDPFRTSTDDVARSEVHQVDAQVAVPAPPSAPFHHASYATNGGKPEGFSALATNAKNEFNASVTWDEPFTTLHVYGPDLTHARIQQYLHRLSTKNAPPLPRDPSGPFGGRPGDEGPQVSYQLRKGSRSIVEQWLAEHPDSGVAFHLTDPNNAPTLVARGAKEAHQQLKTALLNLGILVSTREPAEPLVSKSYSTDDVRLVNASQFSQALGGTAEILWDTVNRKLTVRAPEQIHAQIAKLLNNPGEPSASDSNSQRPGSKIYAALPANSADDALIRTMQLLERDGSDVVAVPHQDGSYSIVEALPEASAARREFLEGMTRSGNAPPFASNGGWSRQPTSPFGQSKQGDPDAVPLTQKPETPANGSANTPVDSASPTEQEAEKLRRLFQESASNEQITKFYTVPQESRQELETAIGVAAGKLFGSSKPPFQLKWEPDEDALYVTAPELAHRGYFHVAFVAHKLSKFGHPPDAELPEYQTALSELEKANADAARAMEGLPPAHLPPAPFPTLENQKITDRAYKLLGLELEPLTPPELERVKKLGYNGGLRVAAFDPHKKNGIGLDALLVGLHVWPITDLQTLDAVLTREDLDDLSPLRFRAIVQASDSPLKQPEDRIISGRMPIDAEVFRSIQRSLPSNRTDAATVAPGDLSSNTRPEVDAALAVAAYPEAFANALKQSRKAGKPVIVHFLAHNSEPSQRFVDEILANEQVVKFIDEHFIPVTIYADDEPAFAKQFQVSLVPANVFVFNGGTRTGGLAVQGTPAAYIAHLQQMHNIATNPASSPIRGEPMPATPPVPVADRPDDEKTRVESENARLRMEGLKLLKDFPADVNPDELKAFEEKHRKEGYEVLVQRVPETGAFRVAVGTKIKVVPYHVKEATFLYDGKTFDQWRDLWKLELNPERRSEAISAMAAFGRTGHGDEAVSSILDVAAEYDFNRIDDSKPEGRLKERILESLAPDDVANAVDQWLPLVLKRMKSDPQKWDPLLIQLLARTGPPYRESFALAPENLKLLKQAAADPAYGPNARIVNHLFWSAPEDEEVAQLVKATLAGKDAANAVELLRNIGYRRVDEFPEKLELLFHSDPAIRRMARTALYHSLDPGTHDAVSAKLLAILADQKQADRHADAIRAIAAIVKRAGDKPNPGRPTLTNETIQAIADGLTPILAEGSAELIPPAFLVAVEMRATLKYKNKLVDFLSNPPEERMAPVEAALKASPDEEAALIDQPDHGGGMDGSGGGFF